MPTKKDSSLASILNGHDRKNVFKVQEDHHEETQFSASELERYYQAAQGHPEENTATAPAGSTNPVEPTDPAASPTQGAAPQPNPYAAQPQTGYTTQPQAGYMIQPQMGYGAQPQFPGAGQNPYAAAPGAAGAQNPPKPPKKKLPHKAVVTILLMLGIVLVVGLALLMINAFNRTPAASGTRTVMVYMLGGDLESSEGMASADLAEMQAANTGSDTHVLVYTAGAGIWHNTNVRNNTIYEVGNGSLSQRATLSSSNAATAQTLSDFIEYTLEHYSSDLYDLIIWGRAGGASGGLGNDDVAVANTSLTLSDITSALSENQFGSSRTLELIGFDAPLMGSAETAVAFKDYSNYLVASEEMMPATGWNYGYLSAVSRSTSSSDLVSMIVDHYAGGLADFAYGEQFWTLSAINLQLIDDFVAASDTLFTALAEELTWDNYSQFAGAVTQSTVFGYDGSSSYDYVDLASLLDAIANTDLAAASEATNARQILGKTVVARNGNVTAAQGLSTYFVTYNKPATNAGLSRAQAVSWSSGYASFLDAYARFASGSKQVASGSFVGSNASYADGTLSMQLPDDLSRNFERATATVWQRLDSNRYVKVYESLNVTRDGSTLTASNLAHQLIAVDTMSSGGLEATALRQDEGATYYAVPVALSHTSGATGLATQNATAIYKLVTGETTLRLVDLRLPTSRDLAGKGGINLDNWSTMNFNVNAYYLLDNASDLNSPADTHTSWGTASSTMLHLDREYSVQLADLGEGEYVAQFTVTDTQGDVHYSQLVSM